MVDLIIHCELFRHYGQNRAQRLKQRGLLQEKNDFYYENRNVINRLKRQEVEMMDKSNIEENALIQDTLMAKLNEAADPNRDCFSVDDIDAIMRQFHNTQGDEKEKLRKKDQAFVNGIDALRKFIAGQGYMPQHTALAFRAIAGLLTIVENILWELKGEKGEPPKPQQPPRP